MSSDSVESLFEAGLVRSWIPNDLKVNGAALVLEHEVIPFESHPAEFTSLMHWQAAYCTALVTRALNQLGYTLVDAHPWNIMFKSGRPVFVDFGSIIPGRLPSDGWTEEFYRYFAAPIWLAAKGFLKLSAEYRKEHRDGFGHDLFQNRKVRFLTRFNSGLARRKHDSANAAIKWLLKKRPKPAATGVWSSYEQAHGVTDTQDAQTEKQIFVRNVLSEFKPSTVLDCAANGGHYALMAVKTEAKVVAFDYQEDCVNTLLALAEKYDAPITPALIDFLSPTPPFGLGLVGGSAFDRYRCSLVLALGLIHHACITQGLPISVFCSICSEFARELIVVEFVHSDDCHIIQWSTPPVYCLSNMLTEFCRLGWLESRRVDIRRDGISRTIVLLRFAKARHIAS